MHLLCYSGDNSKQRVCMYVVSMWVFKGIFDPMLGEVIDIELEVTEDWLQFLTCLCIIYPES